MARFFVPIANRQAFDDFQLSYELNKDRSRFLPNAVGNAAAFGVEALIFAWLAGLREAMRPALAPGWKTQFKEMNASQIHPTIWLYSEARHTAYVYG
jgi:hypothetical protein